MRADQAAATVVRSLGFAAACSIAISNMIGQGVFLKARAMTCNVGSPSLVLAAWAVAGLLSLCGALTLGELGAAIPESGGPYAFLRRAFGGAAAFAYGWMGIFISSPASIAALAAGSAIFFNLASGHALDALALSLPIAGRSISIAGVQTGAAMMIVIMTAVNCAPAVVNGGIATASAVLKIGMLAGLTVAAFALGHGDWAHLAQNGAAGTCGGIAANVRGGGAGFAAALIGALYAYNGWHSLTLVAGEVKHVGRTLPLALMVAVAVVIVLYVGGNAAFIFLLSPLTIANLAPNGSVGVAAAEALFGPAARILAAVFLFASVAATLHVTILTNARITYAFAQDIRGFSLLHRVSPRGHVPVNAILLNSALAIAYVLAGSFDTLSNFFIFNGWVFFVATGVAMFVLRRREPGLPRPYRTFGYPVIPAIYVGVGAWLVVQTAVSNPQAAAIGAAILAVSFPVYYAQRRLRT